MKKLILALIFVGAMSQSIGAQTNYNLRFASLDADVNGAVSKGEFLVAFPKGDTRVFELADADKNGMVSHEEWEAYKQSQGLTQN